MADKALLIGINRYARISGLRGCVNDVRTMNSLLTDMFGFSPTNIRTLIDDRATKERVLKEWKWLLSGARTGDRLVFHGSGHGSFINDVDADEKDGVDELFCLYDMDFDDPQTYLLDDDLRVLTEQVPAGVFLTVVLDSCHSGTGTRLAITSNTVRGLSSRADAPLVDLDNSLARLRNPSTGTRSLAASEPEELLRHVTEARSLDEARDTVLIRFVEPPPRVIAAIHKGGVRSAIRPSMVDSDRGAKMAHVLLAGCRANQTSADAFIDGDYHGAFTYYFNESARKVGQKGEYRKVISGLAQALASAGFSQVPQLEPQSVAGVLFGSQDAASKPFVQSDQQAKTENKAESTDDLRQELVALVRELRSLIRREKGPQLTRGSGDKALVYIHGICRHDPGYSEPWWNALRPHLDSSVRAQFEASRREVLWSNLVSASRDSEIARSTRELEEERQLAEVLRDALEDRASRESLAAVPQQREGVAPTASQLVTDRALFGIPGLDCVDDFAKYLLNPTIRREVQNRFSEQVRPLLQSGFEVTVVSHSWGTVVAYEALRHMDADRASGRVATLFTVGSALSIVPVQRRLEFQDGRRPTVADRWVNLDARGDIVGGPLARLGFGIDQEFLNLHPTTCREVLTAVSPACAHSSYFAVNNVEVNRDIFAALMRD